MIFQQKNLLKPITKPLRFVFVPKSDNPWYDAVREGAEDAVAEYKRAGIEIQIVWDAPPEADMSLHKQKIEAAIKTRPDGLAVACLAPATDARVINDAVNADLPVLTFDTDAPQSLRAAYIGHSDDYQDGVDLGELLAKKLNYTGRVGILAGTLSAPNHAGRVNGFKAALGRHKNMQIAFTSPDSDDLQEAEYLTEMALKNYPELWGFFCCNAINPVGCARAVSKANKAGQIHIVGMDALPETLQYLKDGVIDAVKVQRQSEIGYWSVVYLVALNRGHTVPNVHEIGTTLLTTESLVA